MDPEPDDSGDWRRQPEWWGVGTVIDVLAGQWECGEAEGKIDRTFVGPNSVAICRTIGRGRMQGSAELVIINDEETMEGRGPMCWPARYYDFEQ